VRDILAVVRALVVGWVVKCEARRCEVGLVRVFELGDEGSFLRYQNSDGQWVVRMRVEQFVIGSWGRLRVEVG
jgi:hypothetical protein